MELQLSLALPSNHVKGFDLNVYVHEPNEIMGLDASWNNLGCVLSVPTNCSTDKNICCNKKRSFEEAFEQVIVVPRTLPLLRWNKEPDDEDELKDQDNNSSFGSNKISDDDGVVGWPPIKKCRKKISYQHHGGRANKNQTVATANDSGCGCRQSNSVYVKVKMEGVAVARKINISLYNSFEALTTTLISMFGLWNEGSDNYELTFQDGEGDWLIAQDVSWRTFIRTVQRLKLSKSSG